MRDVLIQYLLGELDEESQRRLEQRLAESAELRRELAHLRACFCDAGGTSAGSDDLPAGLAARTTSQIAGLPPDATGDALPPSSIDPPAATFQWNLADISVAAGVFLAVSMLLLPALGGSRDMARRVSCADNLRQLGQLHARYAGENGGVLPSIGPSDYVGIFASILVEGGLIEIEELKPLLICRASPQGDAAADGTFVLNIPTTAELRSARGHELERLLQQFLFSYAYRIGYVEDNKYHCERKRRPSCDPLMADAPAFDAFGQPVLANHRGKGFNLLHEGGHVTYQRDPAVPGDVNLYLNLLNRAAAGHGKRDVVLARSRMTPGVAPVQSAARAPTPGPVPSPAQARSPAR